MRAAPRFVEIRRKQVDMARQPHPWDLTNDTLYRLCREHPNHTDEQTILAKINIIGRVYAAAIERRKLVQPDEKNESFYISRVAPVVMRSPLDEWIGRARMIDPNSSIAFALMLEIHWRTTDLFSQISGLNKRSLASKYLHFHIPDLFFIYDSRARRGIGTLSLPKLKVKQKLGPDVDPSYRAFASKCAALRSHCESRFGMRLTPRELDNFLLAIST